MLQQNTVNKTLAEMQTFKNFMEYLASQEITRANGDTIKPFAHYLLYLEGIKSLVTAPNTTVNIDGTEYDSIRKIVEDGLTVIDNLDSNSAINALSANQGRLLNLEIQALEQAVQNVTAPPVIDEKEYSETTQYVSGSVHFFYDDATKTTGAWYECYHPNGCINIDPRLAENRPTGWTNADPDAPFHWLKLGVQKATGVAGKMETWQSLVLPENRIIADGSTLNASKYWRLAQALPDFVSNNAIIFPASPEGQFIRYAGGVDPDTNRAVATTQGDAMRNLAGNLTLREGEGAGGIFRFTGRSNGPSISYLNSNIVNQKNNYTINLSNAGIPVADEIRPTNINYHAVMCI